MELRQLEYLVAVAEAASFSAAARRLGVTQPSISEQIRKLEAELRQPLLDRLPRRVVPTPAGQKLISHARRILTEVSEASRTVCDANAGRLGGRLAVGAIPTVAPFLLPRLVRAFERRHPGVELTVTEDTTARLIDQITHGDLDLAIASTAPAAPHLQIEPIDEEPLLLMLPSRHVLAKTRRVAPDALASERFVALHEMHCLADQASRFCLQRELRPPVVMHGSNLFTLSAMVAGGMGVSLVPRMMAMNRTCSVRGCTFRPFAGDPPTRPLTLLWPLLRYRSAAARAFAKMATAAVRPKR